MNGKEVLVDTNIILFLLTGSNTLEEILQGKDIYLSFITELELIGYKDSTSKRDEQIAGLLDDCSVISMNNLIKDNILKLEKNIA